MTLDSGRFARAVDEDARLVILRALALRPDGRLNESLLADVLDQFGHSRTRDWLRTQLHRLAELGALELSEAGSVMVAAITVAGVDHVERRATIAGVRRPRPGTDHGA